MIVSLSQRRTHLVTKNTALICFCSVALAFLFYQYIQLELLHVADVPPLSQFRETHRKIDTNFSEELESKQLPLDKYDDLCIQTVKRLQEIGVDLIALDFDLTIVDIHTSGHWSQGPHALASHVRPQIVCLVRYAMAQGLLIAVASFSAQEELLRETVCLAMQPVDTTNIMIVGGQNYAEETGKRRQLHTILTSLNNTTKSPTPSSTMLIDDDKRNVRLAVLDGYRGVWFDTGNVELFFQKLRDMQVRTRIVEK